MKPTEEERKEIWRKRCARVKKLIDADAPPTIILYMVRPLISEYGWIKFLWFSFRSWYGLSVNIPLWFFWHKTILRKSQKEIEEQLDKGV